MLTATRQGQLSGKDSGFWDRKREATALRLFREAARRVPAYADFLRRHKIDPQAIRTMHDFRQVPCTDKATYLRQYPLHMLCWDGTLARQMTFTSTSGSTGQPFYFPRSHRVEWQSSVIHESFLRRKEEAIPEPTLVIVCFAMGSWIGGLITYKALDLTARRTKLPISIITPGINKQEIFEALRTLAPAYKHVVLTGYPPFIKDIVDEAPQKGIDLHALNLRIIFAAEAFTETFRNYIAEKAGISDVCRDTMNIYGSADIGTMAFETPLTIYARRRDCPDHRLLDTVLGNVGNIGKMPTVAQYHPGFICFEEQDSSILLTGNNAVPLMRYAIGDRGGVMGYDDFVGRFGDLGVDLPGELAERCMNHLHPLPLVYVYERSDFSTKVYGLIVFPGPVREALEHPSVAEATTGKFTMITKADEKLDQFLEINIELRPQANSGLKLAESLKSLIVASLLSHNAEFRSTYTSMPDRVVPRIVLWPHEHPEHFKPGVKQKWVKECHGTK